jgi:ferric-dicitrate binding protein FerR (iron transport regulator)
MPKDYESYSTEEFLDDPFFIEWVRHQTPGSVRFWSQWINSAPANIDAVQEAEWQLRAILSAERIEAAAADEQQVWQQINKKIGGEESAMPWRKKGWMAAAAAVLLLLVGGWWFVQGSHSTQQPPIAATPKVQDIAPGGNKAILTLADGTQVILDSANNGAITKQGNVTVIKLDDGQLAYNASSTSTSALTYNTVTTPRGGQYQLILSDGTKVWLNAASSLRFPTAFVGSERKVEMTGEGYFEVAHIDKKPFLVRAGGMDVEVLGTHFNINAYEDEGAVKTTLLEGKVRASTGHDQAVVLKPGEQARLSQSNAQLSTLNNINVEEVIAWKNGKFQFGEAMDIGMVMRQLSRWYDLDVVYDGKVTGHIGGTISRNVKISEVLKMLEMTGAVHFVIRNREVIVKPG